MIGHDEDVCLVCDRFRLRTTLKRYLREDLPLERMRKRLRPPDHLDRKLVDFYDVSPIDQRLANMMLSSKGVIIDPVKGVPIYLLCDCCLANLKSGRRDCVKPHGLCIANGFYIGEIADHLFQASWPEHAMTKTVSILAVSTVLRGGQNKAMKSHVMCFDATPGPYASLLPKRLNENEQYHLIFAGPFTDAQKAQAMKQHLVRHDIVQRLLTFYQENNRTFYNEVRIDIRRLNDLNIRDGEVPDGIFHIFTAMITMMKWIATWRLLLGMMTSSPRRMKSTN